MKDSFEPSFTYGLERDYVITRMRNSGYIMLRIFSLRKLIVFTFRRLIAEHFFKRSSNWSRKLVCLGLLQENVKNLYGIVAFLVNLTVFTAFVELKILRIPLFYRTDYACLNAIRVFGKPSTALIHTKL